MKKLFITLILLFVFATSAQAIVVNFGCLTPYDGDFVIAPPLQAEFGASVIIQPGKDLDYVYLKTIGTDLIFVGYVPDDEYPWRRYSVFESLLGTLGSKYFVLDPGIHSFPVKQLFRFYSEGIFDIISRCVDNGEISDTDMDDISGLLEDIYLLGTD